MKCWLAASGVLICTRTQGCAREGESIVSPWHEDGNWRRVLGSLYPRINHGITDCFGLGMTSRILQLQPHGQEGLDPTCVHQTEGTAGEILQSFIPCCSWISPGRGTPSSDPDPRSVGCCCCIPAGTAQSREAPSWIPLLPSLQVLWLTHQLWRGWNSCSSSFVEK